jgi:hypothetical protein
MNTRKSSFKQDMNIPKSSFKQLWMLLILC